MQKNHFPLLKTLKNTESAQPWLVVVVVFSVLSVYFVYLLKLKIWFNDC